MPIYTRGGDKGKTNIGAKRCPKDCPNVEVMGEIDELVSLLGVVASRLEDPKEMEKIIGTLMGLNAHIMSEGKYAFKGDVDFLEKRIDEMWKEMGKLTHFILRFTDETASLIHYARAVCRRVERRLVAFAKANEWVDKNALAYVNRLSDYLFVLARWVNKKNEGEEIEWR